MQKQAPSIGRILVAVGFTLSCFGLILFLWIAFGGPIPLAPESYRITAYFPEATQLAVEGDVRIGGVSVGKVKSIGLAPEKDRVNGQDTTEAELEIDPEFAPISSDAKAILRQKTLLGETFIELTSGTEPDSHAAPVALGSAANVSDAEASNVESIPEGGSLGLSQTQDATQIDEIFNALDEETRQAFQDWMQNSAVAINGRGLDLNDALGNLGPFVVDSSNILSVLRRQKVALRGLVHDTGTVFNALSERNQELAGAITGSDQTFSALASESKALSDTFKILPVFQRESRLTFERLDQFQHDTDPLIEQLIPVAHDLTPTLHSVRELSPHLQRLFPDLDKLIDVSKKGLPALRRFLNGVSPVLDALDPFLANLNPVIRYLKFQKTTVTDFLAAPSAALAQSADCPDGTSPPCSTHPGAPSYQPAARHYLRQLSYTSAETFSIWPNRLNTNRGNGYLAPNSLNSYQAASAGIFPNFDCRNLDYHPGTTESDPEARDEETLTWRDHNSASDVNEGNGTTVSFAPCVIQPDYPSVFGGERFPQLYSDP